MTAAPRCRRLTYFGSALIGSLTLLVFFDHGMTTDLTCLKPKILKIS